MLFLEDNNEPERTENELHRLYRTLPQPEIMFSTTEDLIKKGVNVNQVDSHGNTPLSYLVLHINRGLRYHAYTIPQIQRLVDLNASAVEIENKCIELDSDYQEQVYKCLKYLLENGADPNFLPEKCPSIAHDILWTKAYENKLLQQEGRWNLLERGLKMDYTKFNFFDPLASGKVESVNKLNILHLACWRGDADCIDLLLKHNAKYNERATDGRNALHFLYQYCNKPSNLVKATGLLIEKGICVSMTDSYGHAPFQTLLKHCLISRSYVKYLANSYTPEYRIDSSENDHYRTEVLQCIELLLNAGQDVNHRNKWLDGALHILLYNFQCSLEDAEEEFQTRGHYLVPYQFKLQPVTQMIEFLLKRGYEVNTPDTHGRTPIHYVIHTLLPLSLHNSLNTLSDITDCLKILVKYKANLNAKSNFEQTVAHGMAQVITTKYQHITVYTDVLLFLISEGLNLNARDRFGKAVIHYIIQAKSLGLFNPQALQRLLLILLRSGANPNMAAEPVNNPGDFMFYEGDQKYPLTLLLRLHVFHHDPTNTSVQMNIEHYIMILEMLCQCMSPEVLQHVFYQYCDKGFYGTFCESQCPVFQVLYRNSHRTRTLMHLCRLSIWESCKARLNTRSKELPLPREIRDYVLWTT